MLRVFVPAMAFLCAGFLLGQLSAPRPPVNPTAGKKAIEVTDPGADGVQTLAQLAALGYTSGAYDPQHAIRGVDVFDEERAMPGVNFYSSRPRSAAMLVSMNGRELHRWSYSLGSDGWQHAELLGDGSLLVVVKDNCVFRIDRDSRLVWRHETPAHHDLSVAPDGSIAVLSRRQVEMSEFSIDAPVLEDMIEILSQEGEFLRDFSVFDAINESPFAFVLPSPQGLDLGTLDKLAGDQLIIDALHTNHIEVLRTGAKTSAFRDGNYLVSMRTINTIAVIDHQTERVVWAWGPSNLTRQHHPHLLPNGNILVFDNGRHRSQVIELHPSTRRVVWRYAPKSGFFSQLRGSVQRLHNGNTLITVSDRGSVIEVTREGEQVWHFANPDVDEKGIRSPIWRMTRFAIEDLDFIGSIP